MTCFVLNAFSINMLTPGLAASVSFTPLALEGAKALATGAIGAIGHADTATVVGEALGLPDLFGRVSVRMGPGDRALVAQYTGPRLPEGATTLPPGASIEWWEVTIE